MENNVLQKTTIEGIATKFAFKNAELNKFSESIAKIAIDSVNRNIELAKILGRITESKCYKEDGFKSAADYANTTFGINKDFAYQLARVGNKFFNSDDEVAKRVVNACKGQVGKLAELVNVPDEELKANIDTIGARSQKELRDFAKEVTPAKEKVTTEKRCNVVGVFFSIDDNIGKENHVTQETKEGIICDSDEILKAFGFKDGYGKLTKICDTTKVKRVEGKEDKTVKTGYVAIVTTEDGNCYGKIFVDYIETPKAPKAPKTPKAPKVDADEYAEFLAWKASQSK